MSYIQVLLPLRLGWNPTYSCSEPLRVGERVFVSFAHRRYVAVVLEYDVQTDINPEIIHPIESTLEGLPDITPEELSLWKFIADYYMCSMGEVYKAAYPSLKTDSELVLAKKIAKGKIAPPAPAQLHIRSAKSPKPEVLIGSGRLPLYENAIRAALEDGRSALVLVSETKQGDILGKALERSFSDSVVPFSFKLTPARRRAVAQSLRDSSRPLLVIGTRSSLFLPFRDLGLVIVDEEQDPTYKQSDSSPRFNARDLALALAGIHDAQAILGSSCPSLETALNITSGKYSSRRLPSPLAEVQIVDVGAEFRKNGMVSSISRKCIEASESCGSVLLVRGWEKEDELNENVKKCFRHCSPTVMKESQARLDYTFYDLIVVLQADAFFDSSDFRSDERALQFLRSLQYRCRTLLVQTAKSSHPVFSALRQLEAEASLLKERQDFRLPPFVRLLDIDAGAFASEFSALLPVPSLRMGRILRVSLPRTKAAVEYKKEIQVLASSFEKKHRGKAHIYFNVDPQ